MICMNARDIFTACTTSATPYQNIQGMINMFNIALCNCPISRRIIEEKLKLFFGNSSTELLIYEFETMDDLFASEIIFNIAFLNKSFLSDARILTKHLDKISSEDRHKRMFSFVTFIDDPVTDNDFSHLFKVIRQYLDYDSMYFAIEFLTDKGFRSIAISKILFFEFYDRKVKIKSQNSEYICNDTLRNVMSLVGGHGFYQPHKSFIVNLKHITSIKNYNITMNDGCIIPLSQKKSREFRKIYKDYLEQNSAQIKNKTKAARTRTTKRRGEKGVWPN